MIVVPAPGVVESRMSVEVWHRVLENLRGDTSPESFANWLEPLEYDRTDSNGVMHLLAPNDNAKSWEDVLRNQGKILEIKKLLKLGEKEELETEE